MTPDTNSHGFPQGAATRTLLLSQKAELLAAQAASSLARQTLNLTQLATLQTMREKLRALYRRDQYDIHEHVLAFHDELKRKYSNAREYVMFHLVSGSTYVGFYGNFDFPEPDSVAGFIAREYEKAFPKRTTPNSRAA